MSFVHNPRVESGRILQNHNGQYFFVCSTCNLEFVTLSTFLNHQNDGHESNEFQIQSDDLNVPFTKKLTYGYKEPKTESNALTVSYSPQPEIIHEVKDDDKDSADSMDDCSEPVHKIKSILRTVPKAEPRRIILVSPKAKKPPKGDLTIPFTKKLAFGRKEPKKLPKDSTISHFSQPEIIHEVKDDDKDSADLMDNCSEPVHKIKALLRTVPQIEPPRRTIVVPPKAPKPTINISFARFGRFGSHNPPLPAADDNSEKYKCKNCCATFSTMVNLDSHEVVCMILPMRFYCDHCNRAFDDKTRLQTHKKICRCK